MDFSIQLLTNCTPAAFHLSQKPRWAGTPGARHHPLHPPPLVLRELAVSLDDDPKHPSASAPLDCPQTWRPWAGSQGWEHGAFPQPCNRGKQDQATLEPSWTSCYLEGWCFTSIPTFSAKKTHYIYTWTRTQTSESCSWASTICRRASSSEHPALSQQCNQLLGMWRGNLMMWRGVGKR